MLAIARRVGVEPVADGRPGTPVAFARPMSIRALLSASDGSDREVDLSEKPVDRVPDDKLLWIDVSGGDEGDLGILRDALRLDEVVIEALAADLRLPDASVLDGAHQLTLLWLDDEGIDEPVPIQVVAGDGWVITRHEGSLDRLDRQREKITDQREIGSLRPVEFVVAILDWHLDGFFEVAEHLERAVERLDEEALGTDRDLLGRLVAMRQRIARARRIASLHTDVYAEIARPDFLPHLDDADSRLLSRATERHVRRPHDPHGATDERHRPCADMDLRHPPARGGRGRDHGHELSGGDLQADPAVLGRHRLHDRDGGGHAAHRSLAGMAVGRGTIAVPHA
jgi:hypothetical protein